jgi:hypothetical protein
MTTKTASDHVVGSDEMIRKLPTVHERIKIAHDAAYAASIGAREAGAAYGQAAAMAVRMEDWKLAKEMSAKSQKFFGIATQIYATMVNE